MPLTPEDFERINREHEAREADLEPLYREVDWLKYEGPFDDPKRITKMILSAMIESGYTVTAPNGTALTIYHAW